MSTTRRRFLGTAAGAAAALGIPFPASARPVQPSQAFQPVSPTPSSTAAPAASATPAAADSGAQTLATLARERYGRFLSAEQLPMLDERIARLDARSTRLRAVKLANSDEPSAVFRAVRS